MKLRNKQTGEIVEVITGDTFEVGGIQIRSLKRNPQIVRYYASLAELNAEWEDYEEPKEYWCIDTYTYEINYLTEGANVDRDNFNKAIGNYFETEEEAEKAVEKLKAWKRLKDFGCGFMLDDHCAVKFVGPDARKITSAEEQKLLSDAYKLLFGGEE